MSGLKGSFKLSGRFSSGPLPMRETFPVPETDWVLLLEWDADEQRLGHRIHGSWIEVALVQTAGWEEDETPFYRLPGGNEGEWTPGPWLAERSLVGHVKWDGCSSFHIPEATSSLHICGAEAMEALTVAMKFAHSKAMEWMSMGKS